MPSKCFLKDAEIDPLGPKRPLAFLAPTLRLMAPGSSIVTARFPEKEILAVAKRAGIGIQLTVYPDRIYVTRLSGVDSAPVAYIGTRKPSKTKAKAKATAASKRKKKAKLSPATYFQNWKKAQEKTDIFS